MGVNMSLQYIEKQIVPENHQMFASYSYAYTRSKVNGALLTLKEYSVFSGLSLKISGRIYTPNVCVYPKRIIDVSLPDDTEIDEDMPVLAIEILSNTQNVQDILNRFDVYFSATIKSCWLIIPVAGTVIVYKSLRNGQRFCNGNIIDEQLNIKLPINEIFD
jgi:Uma2 family endonuclease